MIRPTIGTGAVYRGTGFFIGKRVLATAGHCVYLHNQGGWARRAEVIPACNGTGRPFGSAFATRFRSTAGWTKSRTPAADYGAIILPQNSFSGQDFGQFGPPEFATGPLPGLPVVVADYPGDKPFGELWAATRKIESATADTLVYDIDALGGQSGAPVYLKHNGKRVLVGIHNYGAATGNTASRVTSAMIANFEKWSAINAGP